MDASYRSSLGRGAVTSDGEIVAMESLENIQHSVEEIFEFCAANDLEIPANLKHRLEKEIALPSSSVNANSVTSAQSAPAHPGHHHKHDSIRSSHNAMLASEKSKASLQVDHKLMQAAHERNQRLQSKLPYMELRVKNGKYVVTNTFEEDPNKIAVPTEEETEGPRRAKQHIETVHSAGIFFKWSRRIQRLVTKGQWRDYTQDTTIIENINLVLEPGKMVLLLGGPGSGKTSILRYIANILPKGNMFTNEGQVTLSGISPSSSVKWPSLVAFMDQIDRLHPYLTVFETCEFAWRCRMASTHKRPWMGTSPEIQTEIDTMDTNLHIVHVVLEALGLTRVKDTFVGDQDRVRGVSGGEKRRVTVAEMLCIGTPVLCGDEISTGLDAATTYDITRLFGLSTRLFNRVTIISLLQPPPETVANFDELILVSEGRIIYAGPLEEVIEYFNALGYEIPERMDVADWLQALPTQEGLRFLPSSEEGEGKAEPKKHLTPKEFSDYFYNSPKGKAILEKLETPIKATAEDQDMIKSIGSVKYANSTITNMKLLAGRELLLWWRDKYQIKAKVMQTLIVGILVGTLFWQTTNPASIVSALFQSMFYACVAQMGQVARQFPERSIFYKHQDANFFPTWSYVLGKSIASTPIAFTDAICYGTVIYFFVGLAINDGASVANYIVFLLLLFIISLTTGLFFMIYSASVRVVTIAQAAMALTAVVFVVFCGFTVQPDVIPDYYIWIYWSNFFAWSLRALAVNEFQSGKYDTLVNGETEGERILSQFGFLDPSGEVFTYEWVRYGLLFTAGWAAFSMILSVIALKRIRFSTGASLVTDAGTDEQEAFDESTAVAIPFTRVDLTFAGIHYTVISSITNEELHLLNGIDGVVEAGKMTALMGSSGAGKTTLMDVLALRKSSGVIDGEVCLNGHLQEDVSFRRCTGYVEQFDMQSPQLTVRETVDFSAKLRLDENDPAVTPETTATFVDQTLAMLELTNIQDLQVGSDATGGLSFEQKKRLSIAVELVANPSILFLDEPTSGLDARAAAIVMRGLKRIALSGRAVCATIHQPSIAIFSSFDSLLLLKRGGEVVFHGELGENSQLLINYFEKYDRTPKIKPGENPATWMLTTIGAGSSASDEKPFDYAGNYKQSKLHISILRRIDEICGRENNEKVGFESRFATSARTQAVAVLKRTLKIYYRTPSYNTVRLIIACAVGLIFSSVYIPFVPPDDESTLNSIMNSIYISLLFLCVNALNTVLALFEFERNIFYRHKAAGMYMSRATVMGFTLAEIPFICTAATLFTMIFYWILGFRAEAEPFFWFWAFAIMTLGCYTCIGQMLAACFRDAMTAQGFGSLVVMGSSLFGGILIKPSEIPPFWIWMYWVMPGHYFFEGLIVSQYHGDTTQIEATVGSKFFEFLECPDPNVPCYGSSDEWIQANFTDWSYHHLPWNLLYLVLLFVFTRFVTFWAMSNLNYRST